MLNAGHIPLVNYSAVRAGRRRRGSIWLAGMFFLAMHALAFGQASREYDLKAVFLYNFASFVEWPKTAFPTPDSRFVIGIIGQDPFGRSLDEVVAGESAQGHAIAVRRYKSVQELRAQPPHILFICLSERERVPSILDELAGRNVLTVSEVPGFLRAGGAINFSTSNRVQLRINADATHRAGLTVSSKLLRIAQSTSGETAP